MSENLFPCRDPAEIAAELFRSCQWEVAGDVRGAAHKAAYYLFQELIEHLSPGGKAGRSKLMDDIADTDDPQKIDAAFSELRIGAGRASRVFLHFGKPPTVRQQNEFKNYALLDRLDMMKDKKTGLPSPNMLQLAKHLAKENSKLPRTEQRGAGSTDVHALEKHIRDVVKKREQGLKNRTWRGPINEDQAIRHFGAKKVATFPEKR
jgi:hypothetical protein